MYLRQSSQENTAGPDPHQTNQPCTAVNQHTQNRNPRNELRNCYSLPKSCDAPPTYQDAISFRLPPHASPSQNVRNQCNSESTELWGSQISNPLTNMPSSASMIPTLSVLSCSAGLAKPIAIPATTTALDSPFLRAYPPALAAYNISRSLFLTFLDTLNRLAIASPPLQVLEVAADIVGFVPEPTSQIVGSAVSVAAGLGAGLLAKGRSDMALRDANRTIFNPRGLQVRITKLDVVAQASGLPVVDETGKISKAKALLPPVQVSSDDVSGLSAQKRRLKALEGYVADLEIEELPQIVIPDNRLSKLSAKASERKGRKGEGKMMRRRKETHDYYSEKTAEAKKGLAKELERIGAKLEKLRLISEVKEDLEAQESSKLEAKIKKIEKERANLLEESEKEMTRIEKDRLEDDYEESAIRKILWLVICEVDFQPTP